MNTAPKNMTAYMRDRRQLRKHSPWQIWGRFLLQGHTSTTVTSCVMTAAAAGCSCTCPGIFDSGRHYFIEQKSLEPGCGHHFAAALRLKAAGITAIAVDAI
jgi:hypothetical protein